VFVLVGLGGVWYAILPPRLTPALPAGQGVPRAVRGAIHVHTDRSDGTGRVDDIAAAAARAGLDFLVLTDHGDAAREPDAPRYRGGVLCIDAVEISTSNGHVLAVGLPAAPYPLGGEGRDVVDDIQRLGGVAIAAHPGSTKPELQWSDWSVPVDGLEWLNGDSQWRDESAWSMARALFTYPVRATETLAGLLDRPDAVLRQWDVLTRERRVVAVAGADAHARLSLRSLGEPYDNGASFHVPSYEQMFRLFANTLPDAQFTGDAAADAQAVLAALRGGHVYSVVDAVAGAATISFTGTNGKTHVTGGDAIPLAGPVTLRVELQQGPPDARIDLVKDGAMAATGTGSTLEHVAGVAAPGVYRVEVSRPGAPGQPPMPWMVSNPIYVGRHAASTAPRAAPRRPSAVAVQYADGPATRWQIETSSASRAALDVVQATKGSELALRYALGGAASASPFAAFVMTAGEDLPTYDRLVFTARADRPMRISVQLREPAGQLGERWHRSIVLDTAPRHVTIVFDDLRAIGTTTRERPTLGRIDSILFVVDTVNTPLGGSGRIWIDDVSYAR